MKLIVNADDFGYSSDVNRAIESAFKKGLISSTSILVNMAGFDEAAALAKTKNFVDRVGIHLNLFEGKPLTKEMQECRIFCDENGNYHGKRIRRYEPLKIDAGTIFKELSAQIDKALITGIIPTHLDSHAQLHLNYFVGGIVIKLAKRYNIPTIRISSNARKKNGIFGKMKINIYNLRLKVHGFKCVNYSDNIPEIMSELHKLSGIVEVIAHPICENGTLMDAECKSELTPLLLPFQNLEKISYAEL